MPTTKQLFEERNHFIELYKEQSFLKYYLKNIFFLKIPILIFFTLGVYKKTPALFIAIPIILVIFILMYASKKRSLKKKIYDVEVEIESIREKNREEGL